MYSCLRFLCFITLIFVSQTNLVSANRIKDLTSLAGIRSNQLVGYGVVVGLAGSGDGNTGITLQSMQSLVSRFGITSDLDGFNGDNAAAVMITADLPPFTKPGQAIDVTVSTVGGATSLKGGTLLMSPLLGADGETYAIAQGNVVVGAIIYDSTDVRAYRVTKVDSDTVLSVTPSIVGASASVNYKIYNAATEGCVLWVGSDTAALTVELSYVDIDVVTVGNNTVEFENAKLGEYLPVQVLQLKETNTTADCRDKCIALS